MPTKYISLTDTAKLIRETLKIEFPGVLFSVRSKGYSGGASITVRWIDGPVTSRVESVAKFYEGATFDGMIDLKSPVFHNTDGGERIHYGADYVFCNRTVSNDLIKAVAPRVAKWWDIDLPQWLEEGSFNGEGYDRQWGPNLNHHLPVFTIGDAILAAAHHAEWRDGVLTFNTEDKYGYNGWIAGMVEHPDSKMAHSPDYQKWESEQSNSEAIQPVEELVIVAVHDVQPIEQIENIEEPVYAPLPFDTIEESTAINPIASILQKLDVNNITPLEALQMLNELKRFIA